MLHTTETIVKRDPKKLVVLFLYCVRDCTFLADIFVTFRFCEKKRLSDPAVLKLSSEPNLDFFVLVSQAFVNPNNRYS